jgi:hypothetical protein
MKKMIFAIGLAVSLVSCGGSATTQNDSSADSTTVETAIGTEVDSTKVDSVKIDSAKGVK